MSSFGFGAVPDSTAPRTLVCDLQTYGKTAIHRGWRVGLPRNKPPVWVFCPLKPYKWRGDIPPKDRVLITQCQGVTMKNIAACPHHKGILYSSLPTSVNEKTFKPEAAPRMKKPPVMKVPKATLDEIAKARREWQEEEINKTVYPEAKGYVGEGKFPDETKT